MTFDYNLIHLFLTLKEEADEHEIKRINSAMLLKGLLEAEESPIYEAIFYQIEPECYPDMLNEICQYIEFEKEQDEANKEEESTDDVFLPSITLSKENFDDITILFSEDLAEVFNLLCSSGETLTISTLTECLVSVMPMDVLKILRTFGVSIKLTKEFFLDPNKLDTQKEKNFMDIPEEFRSFVTNLNEKLHGEKCDISGRDKECKLVWQTLSKYSKKNVILIGEPGVGKTSIANKIAFDIVSGNCPEKFKNFTVLMFDVTSSIAGTMYRGQAEERYARFVNFLETHPDVIVFIDEIHLIRGAGACRDGEADLANALKPILAGSNVRIIGATTKREYEQFFSQDGAIKRRFRTIEVREPRMDEVYPMLKKTIETLSCYHGVAISEEMVDFIILNAACFDNETRNPDRTKDLIDLSMVVAKQAGKTHVDKESVLENFKYNFEAFKKKTSESKRAVAYHEAGHCVVAMCSEFLTNYEVIAVSIMPTDAYEGINVFEFKDANVNQTMDYFIDSIALDLAGRVAEKMLTRTITSGAASDLKNATETAYSVITKYGMADFGANRVYSQKLNSEKSTNQINDEIDNLISKATKRATDILNKNQKKLKALVDMLEQKGIVGKEDLNKIFNTPVHA